MTRTVDTADAVVAAFVAGDAFPARTPTVNAGGARSRVSQDAGRLYSYRTAVAHRDAAHCNRPMGHDGPCGAFAEPDHALQVAGWTWCRVTQADLQAAKARIEA